MKQKTLPVALIQERNQGGADENLALIESRVAEAAKQGAKLVLLQELHNGPYFCQHESVDEFDLAETILFVARLPVTVCINEILMSPTWNRGYIEGVKL